MVGEVLVTIPAYKNNNPAVLTLPSCCKGKQYTIMDKFYVTCFVFIGMIAAVQCADLQCTTNCTATNTTCQWTCKNGTTDVAGDIATCKTKTDECGKGTPQNGTCTPGCKAPGASVTNITPKSDKSGSITLTVSPLILLCGIVTKLFLQP